MHFFKTSKRTIYIVSCLVLIVVAAFVSFYFRTSPGNNVYLTDYTDNDGPLSIAVLSGAIGDGGQVTRVQSGGSTVLDLHLKQGEFKLDVTVLQKAFSQAVAKTSFDQQTCSGHVSIARATTIVPGSGTNAYKGIGGKLDLKITLDETVGKRHGCNANDPMQRQAVVTTGTGRISLK
jgi:hypothetical protein